jgi:hypothetical protein
MQFRYVPILRWKQGERIGLGHLSSLGRADVIPLVVALDSKYGSAAQFTQQVEATWGNAAIYLDAADLTGTSAHHSLDDIRAAATNLHLIPAIHGNNAPPDYLSAVHRMVAADNRGVALRISLAQMTNAASWAGNWPFPIAETDLIIDLASSVASVLALGPSVVPAFQTLHNGATWRSVTMAGGNIPADLTGYVVGTTMLDRAELQLWRHLSTQSLPYKLHFGDYATIGPDATMADIDGPVPINAKYTLDGEFLIRHGVRPSGPNGIDRGTQYRGHANAILTAPGRTPLQHCWSDGMITAIATQPGFSPGAPSSWISYAVNRHIELTRSQLP